MTALLGRPGHEGSERRLCRALLPRRPKPRTSFDALSVIESAGVQRSPDTAVTRHPYRDERDVPLPGRGIQLTDDHGGTSIGWVPQDGDILGRRSRLDQKIELLEPGRLRPA